LAPLFNFRGFCSTDPLLPSCRSAARKAALAGDHMASVSAPIEVRARCQSRHDGDVGQCSLMDPRRTFPGSFTDFPMVDFTGYDADGKRDQARVHQLFGVAGGNDADPLRISTQHTMDTGGRG